MIWQCKPKKHGDEEMIKQTWHFHVRSFRPWPVRTAKPHCSGVPASPSKHATGKLFEQLYNSIFYHDRPTWALVSLYGTDWFSLVPPCAPECPLTVFDSYWKICTSIYFVNALQLKEAISPALVRNTKRIYTMATEIALSLSRFAGEH